MFRLASIIFSISAPTLTGIGVVIALVSGNDTLQPILAGAAIGAVLSLPVSWLIAKKLAALN